MGFVMSAWLHTWRTNRYAGCFRNCDYYELTRTLIEDLIARGSSIVIAEYKGSLLGFICYETKGDRPVVHYLHVKDAFLRQGIEDALLAAIPALGPGFFTFHNQKLARMSGWQWIPEIVRRKLL